MTDQYWLLFLILGQTIYCELFFLVLYAGVSHFRGGSRLVNFGLSVLVFGTLGWLTFWVAFLDISLLTAFRVLIMILVGSTAAYLFYRDRGALIESARSISEPLLYVLLYSIIVLTLGYSNGGLADPITTAAMRFSHELPIDNRIPLILAHTMLQGHIPSPLFADWLASDRPPLQSGLYMLYAIPAKFENLNYQILAVWLQASFLFGVWGLMLSTDLPKNIRRLVLLACCLLPTALINTFYVWPKMLPVGYLMLVFGLLFYRHPRNPSDEKITGVLIGGLVALSILSHGASFFALIGFALAMVVLWKWPTLKTMIYGTGALVVMYLPWLYFQRFIDPPGNRLLKYHLAGVQPVDSRGVWITLHEAYSKLTLGEYLLGRLANFKAMLGNWPGSLVDIFKSVFYHDAAASGAVRYADFFGLIPSLELFSIAVIAALALIVLVPLFGGRLRKQELGLLYLVVACVPAQIVIAILIFVPGRAVNHQGTYCTQVMLTIFAISVLSLRSPISSLAIIAVQAVAFITVYALMIPHSSEFWLMSVVSALAAAILFAYSTRGVLTSSLRLEERIYE